MEQRNEPSTAEIVKALRCEGDVDKCKDCYFENTELGCVLCSGQEIESLAAARLEQLERDLETFKAFHERYAQQTSKKYVEDICALTARAEKAEAEAKERGERAFKADAMGLLLKAQVSDEQELRKQAEAERDAAIADMRGMCSVCRYEEIEFGEEPCCSCALCDESPNWGWRGLRGKGNA